tara:strand:- start:208 stop:417 length:210 start_codon:yes stop_codon:yes gene_type:complete
MKNLILTRRVKQGVLIYKDGEFVCEVTVTNLGLKQCKLGFVADENIKIDRKEKGGPHGNSFPRSKEKTS